MMSMKAFPSNKTVHFFFFFFLIIAVYFSPFLNSYFVSVLPSLTTVRSMCQ